MMQVGFNANEVIHVFLVCTCKTRIMNLHMAQWKSGLWIDTMVTERSKCESWALITFCTSVQLSIRFCEG